MYMHELAQELRQGAYSTAWREKESLSFPPPEWEDLTAISDYEIIDAYVRCPQCRELYVPWNWIYTAIAVASSVQEFISLTDGRLGHLHEGEDE